MSKMTPAEREKEMKKLAKEMKKGKAGKTSKSHLKRNAIAAAALISAATLPMTPPHLDKKMKNVTIKPRLS